MMLVITCSLFDLTRAAQNEFTFRTTDKFYGCQTYANNGNKCTKCLPGFYLYRNGTTVQQVTDDFIACVLDCQEVNPQAVNYDKDGICAQCLDGCTECTVNGCQNCPNLGANKQMTLTIQNFYTNPNTNFAACRDCGALPSSTIQGATMKKRCLECQYNAGNPPQYFSYSSSDPYQLLLGSDVKMQCTKYEGDAISNCPPNTAAPSPPNSKPNCVCKNNADNTCAVVKETYYADGNSEVLCDQGLSDTYKGNCKTCAKITPSRTHTGPPSTVVSTECLSCYSGYGLTTVQQTDSSNQNYNRKMCLSCNAANSEYHQHCVDCTAQIVVNQDPGPGSGTSINATCTQCASGLVLSNGKCVTSCPSGQYVKVDDTGDFVKKTCETCHSDCATCIGETNAYCTSCKDGNKFISHINQKYWGTCTNKDASAIQVAKNYIVSPTGSDSNQGSLAQPMKNLVQALGKALSDNANKKNISITIYLIKDTSGGTADHMIPDDGNTQYWGVKSDLSSLKQDVTIMPLWANTTAFTDVAGANSNCNQAYGGPVRNICYTNGEKATIYNKAGGKFKFKIAHSLTIQYVIFDSLMSSYYKNDACLSSTDKCCYWDSGTSSIKNDQGQPCPNLQIGAYANCSQTHGGDMFTFMSTLGNMNVDTTSQTLTLSYVEFHNFFHEYNSIIRLSNVRGHVVVSNSQFTRLSSCGSVFRNTPGQFKTTSIDNGISQIKNEGNAMGLLQQTFTGRIKWSREPTASTTTTQYSLTVKDSTFQELGAQKSTQYNLYIDATMQGVQRAHVHVANLYEFYGKTVFSGNTFINNVFYFQETKQAGSFPYNFNEPSANNQKCSFLHQIQYDATKFQTVQFSSMKEVYDGSTVLQSKGLIYIYASSPFQGTTSQVEFWNNNFESNNAIHGLVIIDHQSNKDNKALVSFKSNTFKKNSALFGSAGIRINSMTQDGYTNTNQYATQGIPCTGIHIESNTFLQNVNCRGSKGGVIEMHCFNSISYEEMKTNFWQQFTFPSDYGGTTSNTPVELNKNFVYTPKYTPTADTITLTRVGSADTVSLDKNKAYLKSNIFTENYIGGLGALVSARSFRLITFEGDIYTENQVTFGEAMDTYGTFKSDKTFTQVKTAQSVKTTDIPAYYVDPLPLRAYFMHYNTSTQTSSFFKTLSTAEKKSMVPLGLTYVFGSFNVYFKDVQYDNNYFPEDDSLYSEFAHTIHTAYIRGYLTFEGVQWKNIKGIPIEIVNKFIDAGERAKVKHTRYNLTSSPTNSTKDAHKYLLLNADDSITTGAAADDSYIHYSKKTPLYTHSQFYTGNTNDEVNLDIIGCTWSNISHYSGSMPLISKHSSPFSDSFDSKFKTITIKNADNGTVNTVSNVQCPRCMKGFFYFSGVSTLSVTGGSFTGYGSETDAATLDTYPQVGLFHFYDTALTKDYTYTFSSFTCSNGFAKNGACFYIQSTMTSLPPKTGTYNFDQVTISGNMAESLGAFAIVNPGATVVMNNSTMDQNQAFTACADLYITYFKIITLTNVTISATKEASAAVSNYDLTSIAGTSIQIINLLTPWPTFTMTNCTLSGRDSTHYFDNTVIDANSNNISQIMSTQLSKANYSNPDLQNIINITMKHPAPAFFQAVNVVLTNCTFKDNSYAYRGGAIRGNNFKLVDQSSTYSNNGAIDGGAMFFEKCQDVTLTDVTFSANRALSGAALEFRSESVLKLSDNLTFTGNIAYDRAGCISAKSLSQGEIINSKFNSNQAIAVGTIELLDAPNWKFTNTEFKFNTMTEGDCFQVAFSKNLTMNNVTFMNNSASASSTGINMANSDVIIQHSVFQQTLGTVTKLNGGFLTLGSGASLSMSNTTFTSGRADKGGAIYVSGQAQLTVSTLTFTSCQSYYGGAVYFTSFDTITMSSSTFTDNNADGDGSDMYVVSGTLTLTGTTFTKNTIAAQPSFIFLQSVFFSGSSLTITGKLPTTISSQVAQATEGNKFNWKGGGIRITTPQSFSLSSSVIQNISQTGYGGGIHYEESTYDAFVEANLTSVTFKNLRSLHGGAISIKQASKMILTSCTFQNNFAFRVADEKKRNVFNGGEAGAIYYDSYVRNQANKMLKFIGGTSSCNMAADKGGMIYFFYEEPDGYKSITSTGDIAGKEGGSYSSFARNLESIDKTLHDTSTALTYLTDANYTSCSRRRELPIQQRDLSTVTGTTSLTLAEQRSGGVVPTIYIALKDSNGQVVSSDSSSKVTITLISTNANYAPILQGTTTKTVVNGVTKFDDLSFTSEPGQTYSFTFSSTGIDSTKPTNGGVTADISFSMSLRNCSYGESFQSTGECLECAADTKYSLVVMSGPSNCKDCDTTKMICKGGSNIGPQPGYWRSSNATDNFIACLNPAACLGMITPNFVPTGECFSGYQGVLCADCIVGYSVSGEFKCAECPNPIWNIVRISLILIAVIIGIAFMVKSSLASALVLKNVQSVYFKIFMNHMQLVLLTASFEFSWPDNVKKFQDASKPVAQASQQIISFDCFLDTRKEGEPAGSNSMPIKIFYQKMIMYAGMPILMATASIAFWTVWFLIRRNPRMKGKKFGRVMASLIILLFLIHPNIVQYMFASFNCKEIDDNSRVMTDLNIVCWGAEHIRWSLMVSIPSIVIWGLGIPLFAAFVLTQNKTKLHLVATREKYGFLYNGYRKEFYFWESIIMYRKIMLIFIAVFLKIAGVITQAMVTFLMLIVFLVLNGKYRPFTFQSLNDMETLSICTSIATIYCGIFFISATDTNASSFVTDNTFRFILFLIIVIANGIFILYWASRMFEEIINTLRTKFEKIYLYVCLCGQKSRLEKEKKQRKINDENDILKEEFERALHNVDSVVLSGKLKLDATVIQKVQVYLNPDTFIEEVQNRNLIRDELEQEKKAQERHDRVVGKQVIVVEPIESDDIKKLDSIDKSHAMFLPPVDQDQQNKANQKMLNDINEFIGEHDDGEYVSAQSAMAKTNYKEGSLHSDSHLNKFNEESKDVDSISIENLDQINDEIMGISNNRIDIADIDADDEHDIDQIEIDQRKEAQAKDQERLKEIMEKAERDDMRHLYNISKQKNQAAKVQKNLQSRLKHQPTQLRKSQVMKKAHERKSTLRHNHAKLVGNSDLSVSQSDAPYIEVHNPADSGRQLEIDADMFDLPAEISLNADSPDGLKGKDSKKMMEVTQETQVEKFDTDSDLEEEVKDGF